MTVVKSITLRTDDTLVDENNQEIPVDTIVHCLGALFKVTNSGLNPFDTFGSTALPIGTYLNCH